MIVHTTIRMSAGVMPDFFSSRRSLPPPEYELLHSPTRLRFKPAKLVYQPYTTTTEPAIAKPNKNLRLHEILARLGEILLSPELSHAVLFPNHALRHQACLITPLDLPQDAHELCADPPGLLATMADNTHAHLAAETAKFLASFEASCLPPPALTTLRQPLHLCAWRLESPGRVCLFTGHHPAKPVDPACFSPHLLSKALLDERSRRPTPSAVHLIPADDISPGAIRQSLLHYAQTILTPHKERQHQDTTLEEAIACLVHAPARNHSQLELHQAAPWDKDHIDARYPQAQI